VVSVPWWRDAVQLVLGPAAWSIVLMVLSLVILNLRRQFAWTQDLNELCHAVPDRLRRFRGAMSTLQAGARGTGCAWNWKTVVCCDVCPWPTASG
ncbi:MAG: hypothetical protein OXG36_16950, partial [Caldilineaceae bacterium]|nr:hypothetical protein [Caldilineaceae bacterium]